MLGVRCDDHPLGFFPDIYNEDWFFFSAEASARELTSAGEARQRQYDPFADPGRARREEFGDLLAEGLYALFEEGRGLDCATRAYWNDYRDVRGTLITDILCRLDEDDSNLSWQARGSLAEAHQQLKEISADDCVDFLDAWRHDRETFGTFTTSRRQAATTDDTFDRLELDGHWWLSEFGLHATGDGSALDVASR